MSLNLALGIILACLVFGCGKDKNIDGDKPVDSTTPADKSESTTTPGGTIKLVDNLPYPCDAKVTGNIVYLKGSGFQVCSEQGGWQPLDLKGETGAQGPQGSQGPQGFVGPKGGSALIAVYDAQDRKLGWLAGNQATPTGITGIYFVLLTSGMSVLLTGSGYIIQPFIIGDREYCYHESINCTGACRAASPMVVVQNSALFGGGASYLSAADMSSRTNLGPFGYSSTKGSGGCSNVGGSLQNSFAVAPLALPNGASYPFEGPISLKAE